MMNRQRNLHGRRSSYCHRSSRGRELQPTRFFSPSRTSCFSVPCTGPAVRICVNSQKGIIILLRNTNYGNWFLFNWDFDFCSFFLINVFFFSITIEKIDILKWFLIFSIVEAARNEHKLFATGWCLTLEGKRLDRGHFISWWAYCMLIGINW